MSYRNLHYIPISICILLPATFIITYVWAVLLDHVDPGFPYISDTGSLPPESCFFGQMFVFGVVLLGISIYLRYRQVAAMSSSETISRSMNLTATVLGIGGCIGLSLVGNFQQYNVMTVHMFGAAVCFVFGTIYFCLQTWFSYKLQPRINRNVILKLRVVVCTLCVILSVITPTFALIAFINYEGKDRMKWRPEDGGWVSHVISTAAEWILAACFCIYFLTFTEDFALITVHPPEIEINVSS